MQQAGGMSQFDRRGGPHCINGRGAGRRSHAQGQAGAQHFTLADQTRRGIGQRPQGGRRQTGTHHGADLGQTTFHGGVVSRIKHGGTLRHPLASVNPHGRNRCAHPMHGESVRFLITTGGASHTANYCRR
jgi:hypothetical protein